MECRIGEASVHYVEYGAGLPVVALHGAGVDHRESEAALEPAIPHDGFRRIYPDLPGMGRSTTAGLTGNADVVRLLVDFIDRLAAGPALLLGHSYGAYLARGVVARRPEAVLGLALFCPLGGSGQHVPTQEAVRQDHEAYSELDPSLHGGFDEYFVVRTAATARRYRDAVVPGTELVDEDALGVVFANWSLDLGSAAFSAPTLIVAGRHDSVVGCADATDLLETYPHANLAVIEDAGHALLHERPDLVSALLRDWLERVSAVEP